MATYGFSKEGRLNAIDGKATNVSDSTVVVAEAGTSSLMSNPNYKAEVSAPSPSPNLNPTI